MNPDIQQLIYPTISVVTFPRMPLEFAERSIGGLACLPDLIISIEAIRGRSKDEAHALVDLIPDPLLQSPCFLDRITNKWLYDFGDIFLIDGRPSVGVGWTFHSVNRLVDIIRLVQGCMNEEKMTKYLSRLADSKNHIATLLEFAPILRVIPSHDVSHEVSGFSPGDRTIDWQIMDGDMTVMLLEVKSRVKDLIQSMEKIETGEGKTHPSVPAPAHDTDILFKSVEEKFNPQDSSEILQGVWIGTAIKQEVNEVQASFEKLDPEKIHFAILGSWDPGVYMMTREGIPRDMIEKLLRVHQDDRLVFKRSEV